MAKFDMTGRPSSVAALLRAWHDHSRYEILINGGGPAVVPAGHHVRNPRGIVIDVFQFIATVERETGESIEATLARRNADAILVAASVRVRNRLLDIPTFGPIDLTMRLPRRKKGAATPGGTNVAAEVASEGVECHNYHTTSTTACQCGPEGVV